MADRRTPEKGLTKISRKLSLPQPLQPQDHVNSTPEKLALVDHVDHLVAAGSPAASTASTNKDSFTS